MVWQHYGRNLNKANATHYDTINATRIHYHLSIDYNFSCERVMIFIMSQCMGLDLFMELSSKNARYTDKQFKLTTFALTFFVENNFCLNLKHGFESRLQNMVSTPYFPRSLRQQISVILLLTWYFSAHVWEFAGFNEKLVLQCGNSLETTTW